MKSSLLVGRQLFHTGFLMDGHVAKSGRGCVWDSGKVQRVVYLPASCLPVPCQKQLVRHPFGCSIRIWGVDGGVAMYHRRT